MSRHFRTAIWWATAIGVGAIIGTRTGVDSLAQRLEAHEGEPPTSISANGPMTIGAITAGEGAPGIVIHELHTRCECVCTCEPSRGERHLMRVALAAEWRAYKWVDLREYADWLLEVERRLEVR